MKRIPWFPLLICLLFPATLVWAADEEEDGLTAPPTVYYALDPPFVVNLKQGRHFLRAQIQVMAKGDDVIEDVKQHLPPIRDALILLFSDQTLKQLSDPKGVQRVRQDALQLIQDLLRKETGRPGIKAVYFTQLVMQ